MATHRPIRILLVEDNPADVLSVKFALTDVGAFPHTLVHAERLAEGIQRLAEGAFDVVLLDLGLPDSQGLETFKTFHTRSPDVATVVMTGLDDERTANLAIEAGAQDYLVKSEINPRQLARTLRYSLGRHEAETALRISQACLNGIIESSPDGIIACDNDRHITLVNNAAEKTFGYQAQELVGQPVSLLYGDAKGEEVYDTLLRLGHWSGEILNRRKNGELFPSVLASSLVRNPRGEIVGAMGVSRDITQQKQREAEREKLILDLQEALANVKVLSGLIPICSRCKRIRDDKGYWNQVESYVARHSQASFSHGYCPDCATKTLEEAGLDPSEQMRTAAKNQQKP